MTAATRLTPLRSPAQAHRLAVIVPLYNEAAGIGAVLGELLTAVAGFRPLESLDLILVDDGSTDGTRAAATAAWNDAGRADFVRRLHLLALPSNQGHQKALRAGFRYAAGLRDCDAFLVLDGDGQDDPNVIPKMLAALSGRDLVFASRGARAEGPVFRLAYAVYQNLLRMLTGQTLRFGNFCVFRPNVLAFLLKERGSNHLAAGLSSAPFAQSEVTVARRPRLRGESKMSLAALVDYGVAALTMNPTAWVRMFTRIAILIGMLSAAALTVVVSLRLFTTLAIPGWASVIGLLLVVIGFQAVGFLALTAFIGRLLSYQMPQADPLPPEVETLTRDPEGA